MLILFSDALSRMESQHRDNQKIILDKMDNNKDFLASHLSEVSLTHHGALSTKVSQVECNIREDVSDVARETRVGHNNLIGRSDEHMHELKRLGCRLDQIHNENTGVEKQQAETQSQLSMGFRSVLQEVDILRSMGRSFFSVLVPFSEQALDYLRKNMKANTEMYALLLRIQTSIPKGMFMSQQDSVHFEDVLGRKRLLPHDYFRHWDVFDSMLRCEFKGLPGEHKVCTGDYVLMDTQKQGVTFKKEAWPLMVFPGTKIKMSAVLETFQVVGGFCPRPKCPGTVEIPAKNPVVHCPVCALVFVHVIVEKAQPPRLTKSEREPQEHLDVDEPLKARELNDIQAFRRVHVIQSPSQTEEIQRLIQSQKSSTSCCSGPYCCMHHWTRIKAPSDILQWSCQRCHSAPHWFIQKCQNCEASWCRACTQK